MIKIVTPTVLLTPFTAPVRALRLSAVILMIGSLVACAVAPTEPVATVPENQVKSSTGLSDAADMYNGGNYEGAIREFDNVITAAGSSANDRRLSHLGKALVYLGNDKNWHSVDNAKLSLMSAGQVVPTGNEEFALETDLLMDAISAVIGTESKYSVMVAKSSGSGAEVAELKRELDVLKTERHELLAEQKVLHDALEKLKKLTLGN